ncbi:MAG: response regulator transcription factor [Alkalilacustris sp.]
MDILLIEDDARVADFLRRGLTAEGYGVRHCACGTEGLAAAEAFSRACTAAGRGGVILLDVMLPGLDGLELCEVLRRRGHRVPVLILSALGSSRERVEGLRRGADDYLPKPFDFDELLARIEALGRRAGPALDSPGGAILGELRVLPDVPALDGPAGRTLLTAREAAFLNLLLELRGRTISRERILARVWQTDRDPLTNVVEVYASRLRRKLRAQDPAVRLEAVRGLGYRLHAPAPQEADPRAPQSETKGSEE